jgi:hypothetical protein
MPLAYFITFTTYGTWLHGTAKGNGSVDRECVKINGVICKAADFAFAMNF